MGHGFCFKQNLFHTNALVRKHQFGFYPFLRNKLCLSGLDKQSLFRAMAIDLIEGNKPFGVEQDLVSRVEPMANEVCFGVEHS